MPWQAELKVGILVVVAVILFSILLMMASDWNVGIPGREITFTFDRLNNLKKGAAVHLSGVHVGKVTEIELLEGGEGARVRARIDVPVTLREGLTAEIGSLGLVGEAYIALENGPSTRPEYDWKTPVHGTSGVELNALLAKVDVALDQTSEVVTLARELLMTVQGELRETARSVRRVSGDTTRQVDAFLARTDPLFLRIARLLDVLERRLPTVLSTAEGVLTHVDENVNVVGKEAIALSAEAKSWLDETRNDTTRLLGDVQSVIVESRQALVVLAEEAKQLRADLSRVVGQASNTLDEEKTRLNETLARLDAGVEHANALVQRLDVLTAKIESGEGTLGALVARSDTLTPRVETVLDETATALRRFNALAEPVQKLIASDREPFTEIAYELTYRRALEGFQSELGVVFRPNPRQALLASITSREGRRLYNVVASERVGPFVGRAGFVESQGALGFDWDVHRRLTFRAEAVGISRRLFDENAAPRLDAKVFFRPFSSTHFVFGAESITTDASWLFGVRTTY